MSAREAVVARAMAAISILAALVFAALFVFGGVGAIAIRAIPVANYASAIAIATCILLLPCAFVAKARVVAYPGFLAAAYVLGLTVWMYGWLITYSVLGGPGLVIGLLLAIVGIVPLGMIASAWKGLWFFVVELGFGVALTGAVFALACYMRARVASNGRSGRAG